MITMKLYLTLLSDAELGTGLGNEGIDDRVPRDASGHAVVLASHLRGLLRDRIQMLCDVRGWPRAVETMVLGEGGGQDSQGNGVPSIVQLRDASATTTTQEGERTPPIVTITRTALTAAGTVKPTSLRTVEAVAAGTQFETELRLSSSPGSLADTVVRLGLMSIEAIGSGRTRGAGRCRISIDGETRTPGQLLRTIDAQAREVEATPVSVVAVRPQPLGEGAARWFRVVFRAQGPVCCPETPVNGSTNVIRSGPMIPSSAVQGALITRLDRVDSTLATSCLHDRRFRAWPLVPVSPTDSEDPISFGLRVDLTHRMSKLPNDDNEHDFKDAALDPYHWSKIDGSPLRSADGILRVHDGGGVELWKASELPRIITAHGVHHDPTGAGRRNLFSVEALAPMVFVGLVAVPPAAAEVLEREIAGDAFAAFGRARRGGGSGRLSIEEVAFEDMLGDAMAQDAFGEVFVVQSPLVIPDDYGAANDGLGWRAEEALASLAEAAGWGRAILDRGQPETWKYDRTAATCGIRFGWNRHGVGPKADKRHGRSRARRMILPGSVIVLDKALDDIPGRLLKGLGGGREQGYGALLPHPGIAQGIYRPRVTLRRVKSKDEAGQTALDLFNTAGRARGPSPSQIGALGQELAHGRARAKGFLASQRERGAVKHWQRWETVLTDLEEVIDRDLDLAKRALRAWQDLAIIHRPEREEY